MSMFKAIGTSLGTLAGHKSPKDGGSPKPRSGSNVGSMKELPTSIARLVALVREGKTQTALEELAKVPADTMTMMCLLAEPNNKSTLLHAAAEIGSEEVAKAVIAYTGPAGSLSPLVNAQDKQGFTPFHVAASSHHYVLCDLLLEKGAEPNAANHEKTTPLHYLLRQQLNPEIEALLIKCLAKGADIEAKNKYGESALQQSCSRLNDSGIAWLLARKANINSTNEFGETSLHKAARFVGQDPRALNVIRTLVKAGADVSVTGAHGTALELIAEAHRPLVADIFPVGAGLKEVHGSNSPGDISRLRHADSSDKLKGLMAMLQKKRTMRQLTEASSSDLEESNRRSSLTGSASGDVHLLGSVSSVNSAGSREGAAPHAPPVLISGTPSSDNVADHPPAAAGIPRRPSTPAPVDLSVSSSPMPTSSPIGVSLSNGAVSSNFVASPGAAGTSPGHETFNPLELSLTLSARKLVSKIITPASGYRIELGRPDINWPVTEVPVDAVVNYYSKYLYDKERACWHRHWNFIGFMDHERTDPCIISVADSFDGKMHRGSHQIFVPTSKIPGSKHMERELQKALESDVFTSCQVWPVDSPGLRDELLEYETHEPERIAALPVGVIYAREGQMTPVEFWNNKEGSVAFNEFLEILGDKIALQGWSGYAGGLDVVKNSRGAHSIYTHWRDFDIMFHVSTMLPYDEWDAPKVQRSRVIGNDVVNVIFQEGDTPFPANALPGAVTYVFIVVRPELTEDGQLGFRLGAVWREGVSACKPEFSSKLLSREYLREVLLTKILNGHLAAQKGPGLAKMYSRPRKALLEEISESHVPDIRKLAKSKKAGKGK